MRRRPDDPTMRRSPTRDGHGKSGGGDSLPSFLRLPNPPAVFVGRTHEIRWLRGAIERAPVTLIDGASGLGKSALALFVLHTRFKARVESTAYLSFRPAD